MWLKYTYCSEWRFLQNNKRGQRGKGFWKSEIKYKLKQLTSIFETTENVFLFLRFWPHLAVSPQQMENFNCQVSSCDLKMALWSLKVDPVSCKTAVICLVFIIWPEEKMIWENCCDTVKGHSTKVINHTAVMLPLLTSWLWADCYLGLLCSPPLAPSFALTLVITSWFPAPVHLPI